MQILHFKNQFISELNNLYPETEIQSFFNILIEHQLQLSRIDVALQPDYTISSKDLFFLNQATQLLIKQTPIQYITGESEFYGLKFNVNKNVLIPRPETEELIDWIINSISKNKKIKILDIGTGSGCIPISLAKNIVNAEIHAIDISKEALKTAQENALKNNVSINFIEMDILKTTVLTTKFDIIVSNPPYVRELEKLEIQPNVLEHEPHLALFVQDSDALIFYNQIAELAKTSLTNNGLLFFEINQYLGNETVELLEKKGYKNIELKKDIFNSDRMIKCFI